MRAEGFAKVNLGLRVGSVGPDGYHPLRGLFQSVTWADAVSLEPANEDEVSVTEGAAPTDESNLAWQALLAVRSAAGASDSMRVELHKTIPTGAGLGGGSADAAAVLALAGRRFGVDGKSLIDLAAPLGGDVPFAFIGGSAIVSGRGDIVRSLPPITGFALAVVVPPLELSTPSVYRTWDELDEPQGPTVGAAELPPALRDYAPLGNDLYPAAAHLSPQLDDWRDELAGRWGTPVAMTGSGSGLFGYFPTLDEAAGAAAAIPVGARAAEAVEPTATGWALLD